MEDGEIELQACDGCRRFKSDDAARIYVGTILLKVVHALPWAGDRPGKGFPRHGVGVDDVDYDNPLMLLMDEAAGVYARMFADAERPERWNDYLEAAECHLPAPDYAVGRADQNKKAHLRLVELENGEE